MWKDFSFGVHLRGDESRGRSERGCLWEGGVREPKAVDHERNSEEQHSLWRSLQRGKIQKGDLLLRLGEGPHHPPQRRSHPNRPKGLHHFRRTEGQNRLRTSPLQRRRYLSARRYLQRDGCARELFPLPENTQITAEGKDYSADHPQLGIRQAIRPTLHHQRRQTLQISSPKSAVPKAIREQLPQHHH